MSELEQLVAAAVFGAGASKIALAPFEAVGEYWKDRIKARIERTWRKAESKAAGATIEAPDRVRFKVFTEAAFADDEIISEYLGGVLAASGSDDSAASIIGQISRLSARDLRLHYVLYRELRRLLNAPDAPTIRDINNDHQIGYSLELFFPLVELSEALELPSGPEGVVALQTSLRSLAREQLVAPFGGHGMTFGPSPEGFLVGSVHELEAFLSEKTVPDVGAVVRPSVTGMTMMAWGVGARDPNPATYRGLISVVDVSPPIPPCPGAVLVMNLPRK